MQPQRTPSPSVLDIVLAGDISLPPVPEVLELEAAWKSKLTGSPPKRAFSPPTFSQVLQRQPLAKQRQTLLSCAACNRKFYTKSGLAVHACRSSEMEETHQPVESPEVVDSSNTFQRPTPTVKPEPRNKEESSLTKDPTPQVAPPSPNIKKSSSNDRSSVVPPKKDNSTEASSTLPIRPPSPPAEQRKFLCVFCEKPLKTQQGLNRHLWAVPKRAQSPDCFPAKPTLKSVSSPPKRGRWCTECANYVADGLSPENHKAQVHGTSKPVVDPQPPFFKCSRVTSWREKRTFSRERRQHPKQTHEEWGVNFNFFWERPKFWLKLEKTIFKKF
ncbi:hypothetical protein TNIN_337981 [Trichonephila inaurata madagascariensis]|uniref:C2H2-type domain-containing protein n=1 Tax=Trichonephila inaurata madagascariensis TaxID=2747483 RepID=A0A8X6WUD6_9ARAC|nr:hypothetical protein TNIN_337981 [Trichonephila inaurata madagascariensis]